MKHSIKHSLGLTRGCEVVKLAMESYIDRYSEYSPKLDWKGDAKADMSVSIRGMEITGDIEVKEGTVDVDLKVPFMLKPFKGKAIGIIESEIKEWVAKSEAGELK